MSLIPSIISQNFMSDAQFCFRACKEGPKAPAFCKHSTAPRVALTYFLTMMKIPGQHIYDVMGCDWNMPANYSPDVFEQCQGDSGEVRANDYMRIPLTLILISRTQPMGVYGASTFHQGDAQTPAAHPIPSSSSCSTISTVGNSISASGSSTGSASATTTVRIHASSSRYPPL